MRGLDSISLRHQDLEHRALTGFFLSLRGPD